MREAVAEIFSTLGETILLVGLVVLALMGSARSASGAAADYSHFYFGCHGGNVAHRILDEPAHHSGDCAVGRFGGR